MTGPVPTRRVWTAVTVEPRPGGHAVLLDGRPLHSPARRLLLLPVRAVAEAVAAEWDAQGDRVDPGTLPLTRLANTAADRVAQQGDALADDLAAYGGSDLLCYRAPHPQALAERQAAAWDGPLAWVRERHAAPLVCASGVMHVEQPPESLVRLRAAVGAVAAGQGALGLVALSELVTLTGSLVLGLATAEGALDPAAAWAASRIDERWQAEQWGEDAEAAQAEAQREEAFLRAAWLSAALRAGDA